MFVVKLRLDFIFKALLVFAIISTFYRSLLLYIAQQDSYNSLPQVLSRSSLSKAYDTWRKLPGPTLNNQEYSAIQDTPTFVITLQVRFDRQNRMEELRKRLGMRWIYVEATEAGSPLVQSLVQLVRAQRNSTHHANGTTGFSWPEEGTPIHIANPFWIDPSDAVGQRTPAAEEDLHADELQPLTCSTEDETIQPYDPSLPEYLILTPERIAVWHSHISLLRAIRAQSSAPSKTPISGIAALILEDDITAEYDLLRRLDSIWAFVPNGWDIVFLGHCWSDETFFPPLSSSPITSTRIHPSHAPKCTHAYAISPKGARKLLQHLLYPPFAYSRALDQAMAWLVQSKRLESYSLVPSVIVQSKSTKSDVMKGAENGSKWKDTLEKDVFLELGERHHVGLADAGRS